MTKQVGDCMQLGTNTSLEKGASRKALKRQNACYHVDSRKKIHLLTSSVILLSLLFTHAHKNKHIFMPVWLVIEYL